MSDILYITPAEKYTAALGGLYTGDLPEPTTNYTKLLSAIINSNTVNAKHSGLLTRFIYSLYIEDLQDNYPRNELAKMLYWKIHSITPTLDGIKAEVEIAGTTDFVTLDTDLSKIWYDVLFSGPTEKTITGVPPFAFNSNGDPIISWTIKGNTVQSGTPTPDNPVMPQGTGERTGNLFDTSSETDGKYLLSDGSIGTASAYSYTDYIDILPNEKYTISKTITQSSTACHCFYDINKQFLSSIPCLQATTTITVPNNAVYMRCSYRKESVPEIMLNTGSTALPYEPYGVKIPISSANTTTPVYLGEVETTRKIKKYVITGQENTWVATSAYPSGRNRFYLPLESALSSDTSTPLSICSHLPLLPTGGTYNTDNGYTITNSNIYIRLTSDYNSLADFKTYLQQQYAAGTPVCVWYVLATEETAVVNEPLMKIGEYADSISDAITLPTVRGANTLSVETTVPPSEMTITYNE